MTETRGDVATDPGVPAALTGAPAPTTDEQLEEYLSRPTAPAVAAMAALEGDLLVLGAGGKMGHSLSRMAVRASRAAGVAGRRVTAVSRFASRESRDAFERDGIATIAADLLDPGALRDLPDAPNVVYLAGMKFGSSGDEPSTWAMNAFLPGLVARRFPESRIVALSTANVYPFTRPDAGGAREGDPLGPVGEYAQSCLGRERILEWHARPERHAGCADPARLCQRPDLRRPGGHRAGRCRRGADRPRDGLRERDLAGRRQRRDPRCVRSCARVLRSR